jgi:protein gp37
MARRLKAMGQQSYRNGFDLTLQEQALELPLRWRQPRTIFVNSMSDLFHHEVPFSYIQRVFEVMEKASWHRYQVLTKRAERLEQIAPDLVWPQNVWMGVSVEDERVRGRIEHLRRVPAVVRFLSIEPLLGPIPSLDLSEIHWVIAGGESGPGCRPMQPDWVRSIRDQCEEQGVHFFFKQWGGVNKKALGRELDGKFHDAMPERTLQKLKLASMRPAADI